MKLYKFEIVWFYPIIILENCSLEDMEILVDNWQIIMCKSYVSVWFIIILVT